MNQARDAGRPRRPRKPRKAPQERREEALRPCRYLGYDRDQLALHLMGREAFQIAETQFRRAVWLNPYEPAFKVHLAECLYHMHRWPEARQWAAEALEQDASDAGGRRLLAAIDQRLAATSPEPEAPS